MLVATKFTQKRKILGYGFIILVLISYSIFMIYDYYVETLDLSGGDVGLPAYISRLSAGPGSELLGNNDSEKVDSESIIREYFNIDLFYDPKFRALKENTAEIIDIDLGKRDPFKSFLEEKK